VLNGCDKHKTVCARTVPSVRPSYKFPYTTGTSGNTPSAFPEVVPGTSSAFAEDVPAFAVVVTAVVAIAVVTAAVVTAAIAAIVAVANTSEWVRTALL
jgi:hypothetical protein